MTGDLISCSSPVAHGGDRVPTGTRSDLLGPELLAAPGSEDDVRRAAHDFARVGDDAIPAERHRSKLGKAVLAAGDLDQLADPADARDQRLVPFLEVDARTPRQSRGRCAGRLDIGFQPVGERSGLRLAADHAPEHADHAQDLRDAAVIEEVNLDSGTREIGGDVRLQVREAEHEVGAQRDDAVDLRAGERRDFRLLASRARRANGESRDPDDARILAEEVERLGRLLRQADDAFGWLPCTPALYQGADCGRRGRVPRCRDDPVRQAAGTRRAVAVRPPRPARQAGELAARPASLSLRADPRPADRRVEPARHEPRLHDAALARSARRLRLRGAEGPRGAPRPRTADLRVPAPDRRARLRAHRAVHELRGQRARRRARLGRPRLPALHGALDGPEARGGLQLRLARRTAALDHASRQRVPEPHGDRPDLPGRRLQHVRGDREPQLDGLDRLARALRHDRAGPRLPRARTCS